MRPRGAGKEKGEGYNDPVLDIPRPGGCAGSLSIQGSIVSDPLECASEIQNVTMFEKSSTEKPVETSMQLNLFVLVWECCQRK
jgi:hypothetical protein